jgi:hypothetical protein
MWILKVNVLATVGVPEILDTTAGPDQLKLGGLKLMLLWFAGFGVGLGVGLG